MELKKIYELDKSLFDKKIDKLKAILIKEKYPKKDIDSLIKVLSANFIDNYGYLIGDTLHVSIFNTIVYKVSEKINMPLEATSEVVVKIIEAMGCKIEGSPLDLMNKPLEED